MKQSLTPLFPTWNLQNKNVLVRIDANIPVSNGLITSDFKLRAIQKTLDALTVMGANITILTHIGHPSGPDPDYSTAPIADWLAKKGYTCTVLENVRFDAREYAESLSYAQELKNGHDYYITDAWGCLHRPQTSITILPELFAPDKRSIGYLVAREYATLSGLRENPKRPFVLFLGGGKLRTKIPLLQDFITNKLANTLVLLPAIANTFLQAMGRPVGHSLVGPELIPLAKKIIEQAQANQVKLVLPVDFVVLENLENQKVPLARSCPSTSSGRAGFDIESPGSGTEKLLVINGQEIPENAMSVSCGPRSLEIYRELVAQAQTIVYNGPMRLPEYPDTFTATNELINLLADAPGYRVLAGGDTLAVAERQQVLNRFNFCSTGGGATLALLGNCKLPGLVPFIAPASDKRTKAK